MRLPVVARTLVAALVVLLACGEDPVGPYETRVERVYSIQTNDTLIATLTRGDSLYRYVFRADTAQMVALFAQARRGTAVVWTLDSATQTLVDYLYLDFSPLPANLTASRTPRISVVPGQVLYFDVHLGPGPTDTEVALWLYPVDTRPEKLPAAVVPGTLVTAETLENSADIDRFTVSGAAPDVHIGFLQAGVGFAPGTLRMQAATPAGAPLGSEVRSGTPDSLLEEQQTGRYGVPGSAGYPLTIQGVPATLEGGILLGGPYQFRVLRVDLGPETVPALLQVGDTVELESIDFVGDNDRFQFPIVQGRPYNVFLQARATTGSAGFRVTYSNGGDHDEVTSVAGDSLLREQFGGSFTAATTGYLDLEVAGISDVGGLDRGGYRLFVYAVDTLPELVPATLAPGDSVVGETIVLPGDIDRFLVSGALDTLNVALRRSGLRYEPIGLAWAHDGFDDLTPCYGPEGQGVQSCLTGKFVGGPAGTPLGVLSMEGGFPHDFVGPYTLRVHRLSGGTEGSSPQLTPGVPVNGVIDPVGDFDRFTFPYVRGTPIDVLLTGGGNSTASSLLAAVFDQDGNYMVGSWADVPTGRFAGFVSGTYTVEVRGGNGGQVAEETGPYTLLLRTVSTAPETASPNLAVGDSISAEALDELGDIDDFILSAAPGTEVVASLAPVLVRLETWETGTTTRLDLGGATGHSGRILIPAGGQVRIRVAEPRGDSTGGGYGPLRVTGSYALSVRQIDRAPETAAVAALLGVEVSTERIDYHGDVDEFNFAGTQGQSISVFLDNMTSRSTLEARLEVIDPGTSQVLISLVTTNQTPITSQPVTLPTTQTYRIRVQSADPTDGVGTYRFRVQ